MLYFCFCHHVSLLCPMNLTEDNHSNSIHVCSDSFYPKEALFQIWTQYHLRKDVIEVLIWLLWQHSNHSNRVAADAYYPKEALCQNKLATTSHKGIIKVSLLLPWQHSQHSNNVCCWCLLSHITTSQGKTGYQLAVYYEIHIFLLQKLGQGRLNYILTKKMWIKCFKFSWYPVFSSCRGSCPFTIHLHTSEGAKL